MRGTHRLHLHGSILHLAALLCGLLLDLGTYALLLDCLILIGRRKARLELALDL